MRILAGARTAVGLLTILPVRARIEPDGVGAAAAWFPLVGALVGLAAGAVRLGADHLFGATVAAVLAVLVLVTLTGALHQDGLADVADAVGVRGGRERRLEVMRDSTLGTFGVLALIVWALLLVAALSALPRDRAIDTLVIAAALGRWAAVVHAVAVPPARPDGLGAAFSPRPAAILIATVLAAATIALDPVPAAAGLVAAATTAGVTSAIAVRIVGGRTGDTLGATVALTEVVVCLVLLSLAR
ncbi:MAG TPA: adenosylcobinamide-GDP ribazoletransferase [Solirubrobacteraceae bacterium]|nr:adenosylcobinamide-GDP ribazoletransferase [Solirubrobacteraceae bacterium]